MIKFIISQRIKPFNDCYFDVEAIKVNNKIVTIMITTQKVNKIVM